MARTICLQLGLGGGAVLAGNRSEAACSGRRVPAGRAELGEALRGLLLAALWALAAGGFVVAVEAGGRAPGLAAAPLAGQASSICLPDGPAGG